MNEEMEIDLKELFHIILKRKLMIILVTFTFMVGAALATLYLIEPKYEGKVSIVISKDGKFGNGFIADSDRYTNSDVMMYQKLVKTYVEISTSKKIISEVAEQFDEYEYEDLKNMVSGTAMGDTQIFNITVKSSNPKHAAEIANQVAKTFIEQANNYIAASMLTILDEADVPKNQASPNIKLNIVIAMFLGMMISIGTCFLIEYLDTKVKNEEDLKTMVDVPVLAVIPFIND